MVSYRELCFLATWACNLPVCSSTAFLVKLALVSQNLHTVRTLFPNPILCSLFDLSSVFALMIILILSIQTLSFWEHFSFSSRPSQPHQLVHFLPLACESYFLWVPSLCNFSHSWLITLEFIPSTHISCSKFPIIISTYQLDISTWIYLLFSVYIFIS